MRWHSPGTGCLESGSLCHLHHISQTHGHQFDPLPNPDPLRTLPASDTALAEPCAKIPLAKRPFATILRPFLVCVVEPRNLDRCLWLLVATFLQALASPGLQKAAAQGFDKVYETVENVSET